MIGQSWAMLFASVHYNVTIYDVSLEQVNASYEKIKSELITMEKNGILRGSLNAEQQIGLIKGKLILLIIYVYKQDKILGFTSKL